MNDYYINQAGSGIATYSGVRYQKGHGFFGRLISGGILPLLKKVLPYLGSQLLDAGINVAQDVRAGKNFKASARSNLKRKASEMTDDALVSIKERLQNGEGVKKPRLQKKVAKKKGKSIKGRQFPAKEEQTYFL